MMQCAEAILIDIMSIGLAWLFLKWQDAHYCRMEREIFGDTGGYRNKWERMTGRPCQPHDRTGLPTSPPPPRRQR
jgi:hypothetical protein